MERRFLSLLSGHGGLTQGVSAKMSRLWRSQISIRLLRHVIFHIEGVGHHVGSITLDPFTSVLILRRRNLNAKAIFIDLLRFFSAKGSLDLHHGDCLGGFRLLMGTDRCSYSLFLNLQVWLVRRCLLVRRARFVLRLGVRVGVKVWAKKLRPKLLKILSFHNLTAIHGFFLKLTQLLDLLDIEAIAALFFSFEFTDLLVDL